MRCRTLANETTRSFFARLKRPHLFGWYRINLIRGQNDRQRLSRDDRQGKLLINQLAFFQKHFWLHFNRGTVNGWIPLKRFRKNYCQLNLRPFVNHGDVPLSQALVSVIRLCKYVRPGSNVTQIIKSYQRQRPKAVNDYLSIVVGQLGRFKNVSHKSMRRIRNQIWHQRPVVMTIMLSHHIHYVLIVGFNRRVFSYLMPSSNHLRFITRKQLIKAWQRCDYKAYSC